MNATTTTIPDYVASRAAASLGDSSDAVHRLVSRVLARRHSGGGTLVDIGCGRGSLRPHVASSVDAYIGADAVRYDEFPADAPFLQLDLDSGGVPLPDGSADVVVAVETIEHLENPRAFFRELVRLAKPGGLILVTTPNQLSLLSIFTLLTRGCFNAFQEAPGLYPAHLTALLEIDLIRIAQECGLCDLEIHYTGHGRIPFTSRHWNNCLAGRLFSDNILLSAKDRP